MNFQVLIYFWFFIDEIYSISPIVEIEQGKLQGKKSYDINGREFFSFCSIPYAKKPIGDLRFKAPKPAEAWNDLLDATVDLPLCVQREWSGNITGTEDCLYLNVHTPKITPDDLKPVMFFIHGGSFLDGSGRHDMYGPEALITQDVLIVTVNYRLGFFGFLNFKDGTVSVPGNAGLKDQNMALRWIQKNIAKFGGNPDSVTIFGESAGGASVHMQMLSPMSQGLFHRVIAQSGTALNTWNNGMSDSGPMLAKSLGFRSQDNAEMLLFLQNQTIEKIMKVQEKSKIIIPIHESGLTGPVVERQSVETPFLPDTPKNLIESGNFTEVPFMLGYNDAEGIMMEVVQLMTYEKSPIQLKHVIPYDLHVSNDDTKNEIVEKIKKFYSIDEGSSLTDLESDAWINLGVHNSLKSHIKKHADIYFYVFTADTKLNYLKHMHPNSSKISGASHCDELGYLFKNKFIPSKIEDGSPERKAVDRIVELWANFAKFGNPNGRSSIDRKHSQIIWDVVIEPKMNYLNIGTDELKMDSHPFKHRMHFWEEIYKNYTKYQ